MRATRFDQSVEHNMRRSAIGHRRRGLLRGGCLRILGQCAGNARAVTAKSAAANFKLAMIDARLRTFFRRQHDAARRLLAIVNPATVVENSAAATAVNAEVRCSEVGELLAVGVPDGAN